MDELGPILRALSDHPLPFVGGFFSGLFRLSANEDPVKNWLVAQLAQSGTHLVPTSSGNSESNGKGPQRIDID
jgi:hypothetical protein